MTTQGRTKQLAIDELQRVVLQAVATSQPLVDVMNLLCRHVETLAPDVLCSVIAVDDTGAMRPMSAPSLPLAYSQALLGLVAGPQAGSCGTAAWRKEAVEVTDIERDPLWIDYRELALSHGLRACWSSPILDKDNRVVATFALYYRTPKAVDAFHREMVQACLQLCQIAFAHDERDRRIHRLAFYDEVSGLPNRRLFMARGEQALQLAQRRGAPLAVLMLDLDRFKTVNDAMGHAVGDALLRRVAEQLRATVRDCDTLARFGGDEFAVLLPDCDLMSARVVVDKLHAALDAALVLDDGVRVQQSISVGLCAYPDDGADLDTLLRHADMAMYEAKRAGRKTSRHYTGQMAESLELRLAIEAALHDAWNQRAFSLHYQPQVRMSDSQLTGAEVLLRWSMPNRGPVAPDVFIPVAEECGLINLIDAWVLEQAIDQLARWRAKGYAVPSVAVNVSPSRFYRDDVAAHLHKALTEHGLQAQCVTLEITERLLLGNDIRTDTQLWTLREMGVRLAVDDFGTGYSSLGYLKRLPVTEIKLDRSFVRDLDIDPDDRALARAVISIGTALGLEVVAEGVETLGQHEFLRAEGCGTAQGYRYAKPMPADAFETWLQHHHPMPSP